MQADEGEGERHGRHREVARDADDVMDATAGGRAVDLVQEVVGVRAVPGPAALGERMDSDTESRAQWTTDCSIKASRNDGTAQAVYENARRKPSSAEPARAAATVPSDRGSRR